MASKYFRYPIDFSLIVISSLLLVLSFPNFDLGFLAWVGIVPLFIAINTKSLKYTFLLSFVCGIFFFAGFFYWILEVPGYKPLIHHTLLGIYLGPFFGFFGLAFNFISRCWGITPALFAAPFIWVCLEFIRCNLSFLALPMGLLAHSQYQYPVVMQIASITGAYGISFLIVLVNAALAAVVSSFVFSPPPSPPPIKGGGEKRGLKGGWEGLKGGKYLIIITTSLLLFTLVYGYLTITDTIPGNRIKISLVQGNIEQKKKMDQRYARQIMQIYAELTEEVSKEQPALIIWPETATPGSIGLDPKLYSELSRIVKEAGIPLLLGSAQYQKFEGKETKGFKYVNSAFLIDPQPTIGKGQRYDKIRLFPFGEYLPFREIIPWSYLKVGNISEYLPGKEFKIFEMADFRFGVIICWENAFPDLVRQFVRRGAQFMVNMTNEAWFGKTSAPHHLLSITVFRAVENKLFVIRCANTGVSCIIDPYGRIVDRIKDERGQDTFVRGVLTGWVISLDSKSFYTQYGDILVWIAFIGTLIFLISAFSKGRKM